MKYLSRVPGSKDENDTELAPRDEAARAMCHVKGPGRVREPLGSKDPKESRDPSLQGKLNLGFVGVPRCK